MIASSCINHIHAEKRVGYHIETKSRSPTEIEYSNYCLSDEIYYIVDGDKTCCNDSRIREEKPCKSTCGGVGIEINIRKHECFNQNLIRCQIIGSKFDAF